MFVLAFRSEEALRSFRTWLHSDRNHVRLLIRDTGPKVIADSMQLIAGRSGQEYNQRKGRHGAFWEDRYHATAIEANEHLQRCLVYIDLNMVRARVVTHPSDWTYAVIERFRIPPSGTGLLIYGS